MKKLFPAFFLMCLFLTLRVSAQESMIDGINYGLLEKYVQSAKDNYPHVKLLQSREAGAKSAIPQAAMSYLDIFGVSYIYRPNDNTALAPAGTASANPYLVNGFQFGANFNLGLFLEKPFAAKKARADYDAARYETKEYLSTLELEVKRRYYTYLQQVNQLKLLTQNAQDVKVQNENLRSRFEKGEITLDIFTQARTSFTRVNTEKLQGEVNLLIARDALEEIIGKKLTDFK